MEAAIAIGAARWGVTRALGPILDGLLEPWEASSKLGTKIQELKMELLYAQGMLDNARGRDVRSPALGQLLLELRRLAYDADDALDDLEYFRIQDELYGTKKATDDDDQGCLKGLVVNAHHTVKTHAGKLSKLLSYPCTACHDDSDEEQEDGSGGCLPRAIGKRLPCTRTEGAPLLKFDRVEMSERMSKILDELKPVCAKVSTILGLELSGMKRTTTKETPFDRPETTQRIIQPKLFGRDSQIVNVVHDIKGGKYSTNNLTVLSFYGQGGIGKTTFAQHIYNKAKSNFQIQLWICVSHSSNANMLAQDIAKQIPSSSDEKGSAAPSGASDKKRSAEDQIEMAVQSKRFLLVLDDMWTYNEDEWKKLLAPFRKAGPAGNIVIVTTRFPGLAKSVATVDCSTKLDRLKEDDSMAFFEACIFGDHEKPWEGHDDLLKAGREIVPKLKGSPLAVKTVGRLLRTKLHKEHWDSILESKEWELQTSNEDVMPALQLSYNYLPLEAQQCFYPCVLFGEDYKFTGQELFHLWIGLGLLGNNGDQNKRIEDIGQTYLDILVDHGFFEIGEKEGELPHYVIHDLLHELAVKVSSFECLSIHSSNVRSTNIPASIRHLSITIDNTVVTDRKSFENFRIDLSALGKRLKAENLHTLMLFGEYHGSFLKTLRDMFKKAKGLRVVYLSEATYDLNNLFHDFSNLVHLRYLRIKGVRYVPTCLPNSISRFYHLIVLDAQVWLSFPRDVTVSNLVKLRHFVVGDDDGGVHSRISMVGKLNALQELKIFEVKRETNGFGLEQLGPLELRGSLRIDNLENVQSVEEAGEAKLANKKHLHELKLNWSIRKKQTLNGSTDIDDKDRKMEELVLQSLKPHSNLKSLGISGNRGATCPEWLGVELDLLEHLDLERVSWGTLPLPGEMCMVDKHDKEWTGSVPGQGFKNLKTLSLVAIPKLRKWRGNGTCHLLSHLEGLNVRWCSELTELPFSRSSCHESGREGNMLAVFPKLRTLAISNCRNLLPLPSLPWTSAVCFINIENAGSDFSELFYIKEANESIILRISGGNGSGDSAFWDVLDFSNLTELEDWTISSCPPLPLDRLQALKSLKKLCIVDSSSNVLLSIEERSSVQCQVSVTELKIQNYNLERLTEDQEKALLMLTSLRTLKIIKILNLQSAPGGLSGHPSLKVLKFSECKNLQSLPKDSLPASLEELVIWNCPRLRSLPKEGLPNSLRRVSADGSRINPALIRQCRKLQGTIPIVDI